MAQLPRPGRGHRQADRRSRAGIGEQTRFLLSELAALHEADGLLSADDTVVVAARAGWPEYQRRAAYICQPNRPFRAGLKYFGFYAEGVIQPVIPLIRHHAAVPFTRDEAHARLASGDARLATLISDLLDEESRTEGEAYDVLLLTGIDDPRTIRLQAPVANNTVTGSGKPLGMDPEPALHQPGQAHQRGHPHQRTLTGPLPAYCTAHPAGSLTQNIKICFISALARVQTRTGEYHGASLQLNDAS